MVNLGIMNPQWEPCQSMIGGAILENLGSD